MKDISLFKRHKFRLLVISVLVLLIPSFNTLASNPEYFRNGVNSNACDTPASVSCNILTAYNSIVFATVFLFVLFIGKYTFFAMSFYDKTMKERNLRNRKEKDIGDVE